MQGETTFPVQVLREHTTALEAALSVCLADPTHKPVHRLRTETRRVQAQLLLLAQMPEAPEHRDEATALLKQLKRLRRAAGEVRDLDVQRRLLDEYVEPEADANPSRDGAGAQAKAPQGAPKKAGKKRPKAGALDGAGAGPAGDGAGEAQPVLQKGAGDLRAHMDKQRDEAAADLQKLLKKRQMKTATNAEAVLKVFRGAEDLSLGVDDLLRHARGVVEREGLLEDNDIGDLSEDELHSLRKAAKAARYVAETLPDNHVTIEAAERFEALQEAGGQWHDLLDLTRASRRYLGKSHELTVVLAKERDCKLQEYREALRGEVRRGARPREDGLASKGRQTGKRARKAAGKRARSGAVRAMARR